VLSLAVQADGKVLVGGWFTTLGGQTRNSIGRLNADGTLDSGFNLGASGDVYSLAVQADGKVLVGGAFTTLGGQTHEYIGRLNNTEPAIQRLSCDKATVTWRRGGTAPEVWRTTFDYSKDGMTWTSLGPGTRVAGGWQLTGVSLPPRGGLRARGFVTGGGSSWFVESQVAVSPVWLDALGGLTNGQFTLRLHGEDGKRYELQASTDLVTWSTLTTFTAGGDPVVFTDSVAGIPRRFYRLREAP
jgi:hypothetical protein